MFPKYPWVHSVPEKLKIRLQVEYVSNATLLVHVASSKQQAYFVGVFPTLLPLFIINPNTPQSLHKGNHRDREEVRRPDCCWCYPYRPCDSGLRHAHLSNEEDTLLAEVFERLITITKDRQTSMPQVLS